MKTYLFPFLVFCLTGGVGMLLYKGIEGHFIQEVASIWMRLFLSLAFIVATLKWTHTKGAFWRLNRITGQQLVWTFGVMILFTANNLLYAKYGNNFSIVSKGPIAWVTVGFMVNSFFEEFTYRGFLQGYINQRVTKIKNPLSQGNLFASTLMTVTHLGFFQVMDTIFAVTGLFCVLIFSLVMGYLRDKGSSIWFLIVVHTLVNFIYMLVHLNSRT